MDLTVWEQALRLATALGGAAVIGWEREAQSRPAGLRTHMLVALGACLFTLLSFELFEALRGDDGAAVADPMRALSGVIGGVGFLGAGAIIQSRGQVRGLTTAAGIWVVAAIGVAAAFGEFALVGIAVVLAFATLFLLGKLEQHASPAKKNGGDGS